MPERFDVAIIGAGAAGLMAAIFAGRTHPDARIILLDGAKRPGAKILVAGGGRCNVTHHRVTPDDYNGASRNAVRKVLRRFDVPATIDFFREQRVELKREDTGKLFPVTDSARTVLDALTRAVHDAGVTFRHPWRVADVTPEDDSFHITPESHDHAPLLAAHVIMATGGQALPRSGSDGAGYAMVRAMGHTVTRTFPALVPLIATEPAFIRDLSGTASDATVSVHAATGKRLRETTGAVLCTHFGLSGPAILDISRHLLAARHDDPGATLRINWIPGESRETFDRTLVNAGPASVLRLLRDHAIPDRLARALMAHAAIQPGDPCAVLTRDARRSLAAITTETPVTTTATRGYTHAEVTAGGVPLTEIDLATMRSRINPRLSLCGEICDVDGRIGGFNFQWAWASGYLAGVGAVE